MPYLRVTLLSLLFLFAAAAAHAQGFRPIIKQPDRSAFTQADAMADTVFNALKAGETQFLAEWLNDKVNPYQDAATRVKSVNEYMSQLDVILLAPPASVYGALDDYDLVEESYLPGSDRYFRRTYIAYHEGGPIMWEFRYYVKPDGGVALNAWTFNPKNPFEYLATPDMLLNRWYD